MDLKFSNRSNDGHNYYENLVTNRSICIEQNRTEQNTTITIMFFFCMVVFAFITREDIMLGLNLLG